MTTSPAASLSTEQAEHWLSAPRLRRYLDAAGALDEALELYRWNSRLAGAALQDVGHFEVALRNTYDLQLAANGYANWTVTPGLPLFNLETGPTRSRTNQRNLNDTSRAKVAQAKSGLGSTSTHGQVLAELEFGFWATLTRKERTATIWTPLLAAAFPPKTERAHIHQLVDQVRKFRNRLAHNEPTFSNRTGLVDRLTDVMNIFDLIDPVAATWVRDQSDCPNLIGLCPVPTLTPVINRSWLDRP